MMKKIPAVRMQAPCLFCSLNRTWTEIQLATDDPELQFKTMREMLKILYENTEQINEMALDDGRDDLDGDSDGADSLGCGDHRSVRGWCDGVLL